MDVSIYGDTQTGAAMRYEVPLRSPTPSCISRRRRHKTAAEMAGIRRAASVAVEAMGVAARMLRAVAEIHAM
jgi:hypothetical protein